VIDRRTFLAGTGAILLAAPLAAEGQQAGKIYRIGYLMANFPGALNTSFLQGLHDLGYVEGRDFVIEDRFAEGQTHRLPELAAELVRARVDIIVTGGTLATGAAKQATQTIPIVFAVIGGAVEKGMVASLARPGGNVTGLQLQVRGDKPLQLLKEAVRPHDDSRGLPS
jgi:putative ABC transport system substrate-binding protein